MTKIIKNATEAANIMKKGGVVIYPTESSYALGCDATNAKAVKKVRKLKARNPGKYFPVIVADTNMAKRYYFVDKKIEKIARLGITIITKKSKKLPKDIGGFRISKSTIARKISKQLSKPVIATSANISGKESMYGIDEIKKIFAGKVDAILDAGNLPRKRPSTVYDYVNRKLLRKGPVTLGQIKKALK